MIIRLGYAKSASNTENKSIATPNMNENEIIMIQMWMVVIIIYLLILHSVFLAYIGFL